MSHHRRDRFSLSEARAEREPNRRATESANQRHRARFATARVGRDAKGEPADRPAPSHTRRKHFARRRNLHLAREFVRREECAARHHHVRRDACRWLRANHRRERRAVRGKTEHGLVAHEHRTHRRGGESRLRRNRIARGRAHRIARHGKCVTREIEARRRILRQRRDGEAEAERGRAEIANGHVPEI